MLPPWIRHLGPLRRLRNIDGAQYPTAAHVANYATVVHNLPTLLFRTPARNPDLPLAALSTAYARVFLPPSSFSKRRAEVSDAMLAAAAVQCGFLELDDGAERIESLDELFLHAELNVGVDAFEHLPTSLRDPFAQLRARVVVFGHHVHHASRGRLRFSASGLDVVTVSAYWYYAQLRNADDARASSHGSAPARAVADAWLHDVDKECVALCSPLENFELEVHSGGGGGVDSVGDAPGAAVDVAAATHWVFVAAHALACSDRCGRAALGALQRRIADVAKSDAETYGDVLLDDVRPATRESGILAHYVHVLLPHTALKLA
jgi:hypothetical protein